MGKKVPGQLDRRDPERIAPRPRAAGGVVIGLVCFLLWACALTKEGDTNFRNDVISCEEAVAHLQDCCPNFGDTHPDACEYRRDGCSGNRDVALGMATSRCIRDKECGELVDLGICARARAAVIGDEFSSMDASRIEEICEP